MKCFCVRFSIYNVRSNAHHFTSVKSILIWIYSTCENAFAVACYIHVLACLPLILQMVPNTIAFRELKADYVKGNLMMIILRGSPLNETGPPLKIYVHFCIIDKQQTIIKFINTKTLGFSSIVLIEFTSEIQRDHCWVHLDLFYLFFNLVSFSKTYQCDYHLLWLVIGFY